MSTSASVARSNYFQVKDPAAFAAAMEPHQVIVHPHCEQPDMLCLLGDNPDSGWPDHLVDDNDEYQDVDFVALVAEHLADDHVCILMETGHEKLRYLFGGAVAFNNKLEIRSINLNDIYDLAKPLGSVITEASH